MTRISIVVPVYKAEKYLPRCVESLLSQTYRELEIILVDDGSPDNCPEICDGYAEKDGRVKVIHKENGGVSSARNAGLEAASGDYITFVDSDDYIDGQMYEKMLSVAEEYSCDVVMCDCVKEFSDRCEVYSHDIRPGFYNKEQLKNEYYPHLLITETVEYPPTISNCLLLFKRQQSSRKKLPRYVEGVRFSEDLLFGAELIFSADSFYYMKNECFYHYCMNFDSVTHQFKPDKWNDYRKLIKEIENRFGECPEYDFHEQIDKVLLFFIYNAVGDIFRADSLSRSQKNKAAKGILKDETVIELFRRLDIKKLCIPAKLKILTGCYAHPALVPLISAYMERK